MVLQAFLWVNGRRKGGYSENEIQRIPSCTIDFLIQITRSTLPLVIAKKIAEL
jgi:hypothetical protein